MKKRFDEKKFMKDYERLVSANAPPEALRLNTLDAMRKAAESAPLPLGPPQKMEVRPSGASAALWGRKLMPVAAAFVVVFGLLFLYRTQMGSERQSASPMVAPAALGANDVQESGVTLAGTLADEEGMMRIAEPRNKETLALDDSAKAFSESASESLTQAAAYGAADQTASAANRSLPSLKLVKKIWTVGEIRERPYFDLDIENALTDKSFTTTTVFDLEKLNEQGEWQPLAFRPELTWPSEELSVPAAQTEKLPGRLEVSADLELLAEALQPGHYRLIKYMDGFPVCAEFELIP